MAAAASPPVTDVTDTISHNTGQASQKRVIYTYLIKTNRVGKADSFPARFYLWDHCGMMDVPSYREDNKKKLREYEEAGIVPWDNLIVTYDTVEGGLRGDLVEAMIKCWLL